MVQWCTWCKRLINCVLLPLCSRFCQCLARRTNKAFEKSVQKAAKSMNVDTKQLMPYYDWASRNRPREYMVNVPGPRYGVHPVCTTTETYRGDSGLNIEFNDPHPDTKKPWKTTNHMFNESCKLKHVTGMTSNQGIAADVAIRLHKKQGL